MPARILIVDSIATNRIVLKVKMTTAQFEVDAFATCAEAKASVRQQQPDLILINLSNPDDDGHSFCREIQSASRTAIIAVSGSDNPQARFAALDAGADDVLPHPIDETLLMARIRNLLRIRSVGQDLALRDTTRHALGFEEVAAPFQQVAHVALVSSKPSAASSTTLNLPKAIPHRVTVVDPELALKTEGLRNVPDVFVVDATTEAPGANELSGLIADLKSRKETRLSPQFVILSEHRWQEAPACLDLGADDVVSAGVDLLELQHRIDKLVQRKQHDDHLRERISTGLTDATIDPLTGLHNRRYAIPHLNRMAGEAAKTNQPFALMMMDIDHFKSINDKHGHAAGDAILVQLSERLRENLRGIDLIARMGGEEFLVAMPRSSTRKASLAADRLRRLVNNTPFILNDGTSIDVTVSVGVAVSGKPNDPANVHEAMCERADQALYAAKEAGRNQVAVCKSAA